MRYRFLPYCMPLFLVVSLVLLGGCASSAPVSVHSEEWITRPLSELKAAMNQPGSYAAKIGWKEKTYPLANGNIVFVEPYRKDCYVHWEVSPRGIIIGSSASGSGCEEKINEPTGVLKNKVAEPSSRW